MLYLLPANIFIIIMSEMRPLGPIRPRSGMGRVGLDWERVGLDAYIMFTRTDLLS